MPDNLVSEVLASYCQVYEVIYKKQPSDVRVLRGDWVVVNGVQMHAQELAALTRTLIDEHQLSTADCPDKRVSRFSRWLRR
jgi:hypothetical protein